MKIITQCRTNYLLFSVPLPPEKEVYMIENMEGSFDLVLNTEFDGIIE